MSEIWAADADIDCDIHYSPTQYADQLSLRGRILQVQPPQHSIGGTGHVILDKRTANAVLCVTRQLVCFEEEPALVAKQLGFDDQDFWERGRKDIHLRVSGFGLVPSALDL
jgi:hypothetical protein